MAYDIAAVAAAMDQKLVQLDQVTHNLANTATPGFKAQHLMVLEALAGEAAMEAGGAAPLTSLVVDFSRGLSQKTDNPLDLEITGTGFFVVQTGEGPAYTRKGDFTVNRQNQLVTQAGDPVLGEGGPITLGGGPVHVDAEGSVFADGNPVGKIQIVDFADPQALRNAGDGLYRDDGTAGLGKAEKPVLSAGTVESSNVNIVGEMAQMIEIHRTFETYQKIIQTLTEEDKLSVSRVGRV